MASNDKVNILIVDDQPSKLLSYEVVLKDLDESLLFANSARQAFEFLLKHSFAVVLIDVCMPELDGFELAAMIRDHPRFQSTPIIFVSAIALTDIDQLRGYQYGAVDYVPVPVVPEVLRAKVRVFCDLYRKSAELERLNSELERRVRERTAELAQTNAELEERVEQRTHEREEALARIHEMQKLEALGHITGGLSHDFNNLLMAIMSNLDLMAKRLPTDSPARRFLDNAMHAAERGAALTSRLLAFARRQELRPEVVDVPHLIDGMEDMLARSLGPTILVRTEFARDLAFVQVDRNQLELAILNLALNGRDAMPEGGEVAIAATRKNVDANRVQGLERGEYVCISVADTGCGMDAKTLARAAEPFFTTKGPDKGTGLGLSAVFGLATQSGGLARIRSKPGEGTTVEIWLPVAPPGELPVMPQALEANHSAGQPRRILLVDDDEVVAAGTVAMLEDLGHEVVVTDSGARALELLRGGVDIDLVITDHAMPGMTGADLARQIRLLSPAMPIILATGFADVPTAESPPLPRLNKPYRLETLASVVDELTVDVADRRRAGQHLAKADH